MDEQIFDFGDILDDIKKKLADSIGEAGDKISSAADSLKDALPGDPVPGVDDAQSWKEGLESALSFIGGALRTQLAQAASDMATVGAEQAEAVVEIMKSMVSLGRLTVTKSIREETAELAISNMIHALDLRKQAIVNKAKAEAYARALKTIQTCKQVFFALLRMSIEILAPAASKLIDGILSSALK